MPELLRRCWVEEDGLTTVEYAILLALISLAVMGSFGNLGCRVTQVAYRASFAMRGWR